jgi:hypothetical protein
LFLPTMIFSDWRLSPDCAFPDWWLAANWPNRMHCPWPNCQQFQQVWAASKFGAIDASLSRFPRRGECAVQIPNFIHFER